MAPQGRRADPRPGGPPRRSRRPLCPSCWDTVQPNWARGDLGNHPPLSRRAVSPLGSRAAASQLRGRRTAWRREAGAQPEAPTSAWRLSQKGHLGRSVSPRSERPQPHARLRSPERWAREPPHVTENQWGLRPSRRGEG